jgi:gluconate 5-dehydrogenase
MAEKIGPTVQQLFDLSGRVALISGASGHLGFAMAYALAEAGARVVVSSRDLERAKQTACTLPEVSNGNHVAVTIDQLDESSIKCGFDEAVEKTGQIDVLVNNAHAALFADWRSVTGEAFTKQLANTTGYFLLSRLLRDHIVERGTFGSIIMLGSMYGQVASYPDIYEGIGAASPAAYHALKGGIIHLARHLAVYWAKDRVRVNCLSPGPFPTTDLPKELEKRLMRKSPMGRLGQPYELKGAIVFLASDASSYVTGQNLTVDGGWTAW